MSRPFKIEITESEAELKKQLQQRLKIRYFLPYKRCGNEFKNYLSN